MSILISKLKNMITEQIHRSDRYFDVFVGTDGVDTFFFMWRKSDYPSDSMEFVLHNYLLNNCEREDEFIDKICFNWMVKVSGRITLDRMNEVLQDVVSQFTEKHASVRAEKIKVFNEIKEARKNIDSRVLDAVEKSDVAALSDIIGEIRHARWLTL